MISGIIYFGCFQLIFFSASIVFCILVIVLLRRDGAEANARQTADSVMGGIFREGSGSFSPGGEAQLSNLDLAGAGESLPAGLQGQMEQAMGADFSQVRVHTGAGAARASKQISARAFTRGQDLYFGQGNYDPHSQEGQHLIAHADFRCSSFCC